jgi:hypothetical protein
MIRDRDRIYGAVVTRRLRAMGIRDKPTAPVSPALTLSMANRPRLQIILQRTLLEIPSACSLSRA